MKRIKKRAGSAAAAATLALLWSTSAVAFAQDADFEAALFGGSDEAVSSETGEASAFDAAIVSDDVARIEYLVGGTVVAKADALFPGGYDSYAIASGLSGKVFAKVSVPDYGALFVAYNASHTFFQGYSGEGTPPAGENLYEPEYDMAELHYSFDVAKVLFIRVGNQLIAWGPSRIWTPVDFINLQKSDAFAELDTRVGKSGLRLHLPLPHGNLFGFADFSGSGLPGDPVGDPVETINLGGRADVTVGSFELGATVYGGYHIAPRVGLDASGRLAGFSVYGEAAFSAPGAAAEADDWTIQAALGLSRPIDDLKRWTLSAEAFYNSRGRDLSGYTAASINLLPAGERTPLYQGEWYAYAAVAADQLLFPELSATLSVIANLSDYSWSAKLAQTYELPRAVPFTLSVSYAGGGEDKEFTRFSGDGAVSITASTRLEF